MKAKYVHISLILLMLTLSGLFSIATAADTQKVHALLILLGNDQKIRASVNVNESSMKTLLRLVSENCEVQMTVMKSEEETIGRTTHTTLVNARTTKVTDGKPEGIITAEQVVNWIKTVPSKNEDTLLVYYSGHGKENALGIHDLEFDPGVTNDSVPRNGLRDLLEQRPGQLKLLITDTCNNRVKTPLPSAVDFAAIQARARHYTENLFLQHTGVLDMTASASGQYAWGDSEIGGYFTSALIGSFTAAADKNGDNSLSWLEVFNATRDQTEKYFKDAQFLSSQHRQMNAQGQTTQTPIYHALPKPIGGSGGGSAPHTTASVTILNFTSVPSGAEVEIDGVVVGKTPLNRYEIETDGHSTKEIEVTIKAEGIEDLIKRVEELERLEVELAESEAIRDKLEAEIAKTKRDKPEAEIAEPPVITPATIGQNWAKFEDTLLQGHTRWVYSVSFSPDGKTIASGSSDNTLRLWEASTGKLIRTLTGHADTVNSISFSPDGKTIASGSSDNTLRLWEASTGKLIRTLTGHADTVNSVSFSPDGKTIASGNRNDTLRLWEASTGNRIRTLTGHTDTVNSVFFSPDGKTIASGSSDNTLRLWEASTGNRIRTLTGHTDKVYSVSFSPDGKTIASGSRDNTLRLWEASTGRLIRTLTGHTDWVWSVSFSPDGGTIASSSTDNTVRLWKLTD